MFFLHAEIKNRIQEFNCSPKTPPKGHKISESKLSWDEIRRKFRKLRKLLKILSFISGGLVLTPISHYFVILP